MTPVASSDGCDEDADPGACRPEMPRLVWEMSDALDFNDGATAGESCSVAALLLDTFREAAPNVVKDMRPDPEAGELFVLLLSMDFFEVGLGEKGIGDLALRN